jgi:surface antigen
MAFRPYGKMQLGHVAAVNQVIDSRTVLLNHSNWSPINGRAGQVEENVEAKDVSPANDWSEVQVWYDPIHKLGGTRWPVTGFIYNKKAANSNSKAGNSNRTPEHGLTRSGANADPIGNIIAAYSRAS